MLGCGDHSGPLPTLQRLVIDLSELVLVNESSINQRRSRHFFFIHPTSWHLVGAMDLAHTKY
jgi:hypothetical protein